MMSEHSTSAWDFRCRLRLPGWHPGSQQRNTCCLSVRFRISLCTVPERYSKSNRRQVVSSAESQDSKAWKFKAPEVASRLNAHSSNRTELIEDQAKNLNLNSPVGYDEWTFSPLATSGAVKLPGFRILALSRGRHVVCC